MSTTRCGGVSLPPFDALNLGLHVGDDEEAVRINRERLRRGLDLPSDPRWLNQVHGIQVRHLDTRSDELVSEAADGAWTDVPGTVIAIMTADCLPLIVTDDAGRRVAGCHAGWRGLADGVIEQTLAAFPADAVLHAWLGPAIGPGSFEVGAEVRDAFLAKDAENQDAFVPGTGADKYLADIYALARRVLSREDRSIAITGGDHCTVSEEQLFHSHRRDGKRSGRMATLAWLDGRLSD